MRSVKNQVVFTLPPEHVLNVACKCKDAESSLFANSSSLLLMIFSAAKLHVI